MVKATKGVLVECDASIKAMLIDIDNTHQNKFIIEDLDETHLFVKEGNYQEFKNRLQEMLKSRLKAPESDSDE